MTRSNTNNNRRSVYITAVGLLVVSLGAVFVVRSFGSESGADGFLGGSKSCDDPTQIQLATTPEMQPSLEAAAKSIASKGGKDGNPCLQFTISPAASSKVARDIASGSDTRPDLWVPDSSLWIAKADDGQSVPTIAVPSVAGSPLVLVGRRTNFADTSSWLRSLTPQTGLLDPLSTSPGALTLLALQAERVKTSTSDDLVNGLIVPLAQHLGSMPKPFTDVNALFSRADQDGSPIVVPASEQSWVQYQDAHPDTQLRAVLPSTGTLPLDYPIVVTTKSDPTQVQTAAQALASELLTDASQQARDQAGFRDSTLSPLSGGRGVGDVNQLTKPTASAVEIALQNWTRLSLSTHSLAVIDISGSMGDKVGNTTRMQLTIEAATTGLTLFPDTASLGLWTFSTNLTPDGADFKELVKIAPLSKRQRGLITANLKIQKPVPGGSTGLYDTAIAAVRAVKRNYDQSAVNSVLLFTDGKNEDPNSPTLAQTVKTLQGLQDPGRPVRIIALGMGPEVNADELSALAQATGGQAYVATNPNDLKTYFIDALQSR
ncbi:substrate-binding and VWA domain-containing protein [Kribbella sp. NPDC026611]|uniref:substrate-binding and VWA domain-containing protein n=1 Tax=Kribbella sp. NPDC026611 TaxID=3154911 RepID=UPI0033C8DB01